LGLEFDRLRLEFDRLRLESLGFLTGWGWNP
jgi:hypothetical protein